MKYFFPLALSLLWLATCIMGCKKTCQQGYENPNCGIEIRAQFENLYYTVTESKNGDSAYTYAATIIPAPNIYQVQLTNIANNYLTYNVTGTVSNDTLIIAYQNPDSNSTHISGLGTISGNVLTLNYTISYPYLIGTEVHTDQYASVWVHQ